LGWWVISSVFFYFSNKQNYYMDDYFYGSCVFFNCENNLASPKINDLGPGIDKILDDENELIFNGAYG
jgi:hypothetical protein